MPPTSYAFDIHEDIHDRKAIPVEGPNLLRKALGYMIGQMEYANGRDWRRYVIDELSPLGIILLDPYSKPFISEFAEDEAAREEMKHWRDTEQYDLLSTKMKRIRSEDLRCVDKSDFLICNIIPDVASWGSSEEITTAVREKKPLFLAIDHPLGKKACPLWFFGKIPHKYIYNSITDVVKTIKAIDAGIIPMNSDRWRMFKPEYR
jgi:hypothetical protein